MADIRLFSAKTFKCPMSQAGFLKFGELYLMLIEDGYQCIDSETDLYYGHNGFYIKIGSTGGGDGWIANIWNDCEKINYYWTMETLKRRLEQPPNFERIK